MAEVAGEQLWSRLTGGQGQPDGYALLVVKHCHPHCHRRPYRHRFFSFSVNVWGCVAAFPSASFCVVRTLTCTRLDFAAVVTC